VQEVLFKAIVTDLETLRDAYSRAGLLNDGGQGSLAYTLLGGGEAADRFRRDTLLLDAVVRNRVARLVFDRDGPRHVVVFGGNNVGKSTVVNILAAASIAATSPEGGHTRQAHAFSTTAPPLFSWNPYAFNRFTPMAAEVAADQSGPERFDCYTIRQIQADVLPANIVLWDAPDCDAVGSTRYLSAVVEAAAVADLLVYVTSVEKYAVADLVEWLFHLSDAGIPIIECLNKTPKKDRLAVMRKQTDELFPAVAQRLGLPLPTIQMTALRYMADGEEADLWGADHPEAAVFRAAVLASLPSQDTMNQAHAALRFACHRIERLLEPARMELSVQSIWKATVDAGVAAFITTYDNEYLTGPVVIDPFKQLNAALLELLNPNIPQLRSAIRTLRTVQRIPVDLLRKGWRLVSEQGEAAVNANLAPEQRAYATAHRALLSAIVERMDVERRNPRHHPFWDRLAQEWDHQAARLADEFSRATVAHMMQSDADIKAAARDILQALQQRPGVLNLLRAARVSTDIGGLLVGFIIPGHGHIGHDLLDRIVIAPLMLSATGVAAESAVEGYVAQRRSQIVDKLRADAREIAAKLYSRPLDDLGIAMMARVGTLGIQQDLLDRIPANLLRLQQIAGQSAGARA
jgi:hypothetical protein